MGYRDTSNTILLILRSCGLGEGDGEEVPTSTQQYQYMNKLELVEAYLYIVTR